MKRLALRVVRVLERAGRAAEDLARDAAFVRGVYAPDAAERYIEHLLRMLADVRRELVDEREERAKDHDRAIVELARARNEIDALKAERDAAKLAFAELTALLEQRFNDEDELPPASSQVPS